MNVNAWKASQVSQSAEVKYVLVSAMRRNEKSTITIVNDQFVTEWRYQFKTTDDDHPVH